MGLGPVEVVAAAAPDDNVLHHAEPGTLLARRVEALQGPVPRGWCDSVAQWHRMSDLHSLLAKGHRFEFAGGPFDTACVKPKASQCSRCLKSFAVAGLRAEADRPAAFIPVVVEGPPLAKPQRWVQGV